MENKEIVLSKTAYGGISGDKYIPYVKNRAGIGEITGASVFIGILLAILFAGANTYLSLTSGMTIAAGIPGAILGSGLLFLIFKRKSILEGNVMQSMASGGESIASGMTYVLPALIIVGANLSFVDGVISGVAGALIGSAVMVLVRRYLVVKCHSELLYPESMAISEVLVSSDNAGRGLKILGLGGAIGGAIKVFSSNALGFFNSVPMAVFSGSFKAQIGIAVSPALIGVGYIVGIEVGLAMTAGTILANLAVVPLISLFGSLSPEAMMFPSTIPISEMDPASIASKYTRYIGAGAIATGGLLTIIKTIPTIITSIKQVMENVSVSTSDNFDADISLKIAVVMAIASFVIVMFIPSNLTMGLISGSLVVICSFLFAIVAGRMTGVIGISNLPVSGMAIASLLIITPVFALLGYTDISAVSVVILLGTAVVTAIAIGGGFAQSMKTTFVLGGTTKRIEQMFVLATLVGVVVVVALILVLERAYGFTAEQTILIAPQANLMAMIVSGVLDGALPWTLILSGCFIALMLALLRLPVMSVALGFYLPITTVLAILTGGVIRNIVEKSTKHDKILMDEKINTGTILAAGLVAGETLLGLVVAILAVFLADSSSMLALGASILGKSVVSDIWVGFAVLFVFILLMLRIIMKNRK